MNRAVEGTPVSFTADGLTYRGLRWGLESQPLVLAFHGWLDNALSFAQLAPLLHRYQVIALDLSGHGYSSHRSTDSTYHIWDDIPQLYDIVQQLTTDPIHLLGHSRGATIATLLAAVLGEQCDRLVLIDGLLPAFMDDRDAGQQMARFVADRRKYTSRKDRYFPSIDDFVERRKQYGFSADSARKLASRALEPTDQGFRLLSDPRLFGASAVWLEPERRRAIYRQVTAPVLGVIADSGLLARESVARRMVEEAGASLKDFRSTTLVGTHHLHMEETAVGMLAQRVDQFIASGQ